MRPTAWSASVKGTEPMPVAVKGATATIAFSPNMAKLYYKMKLRGKVKREVSRISLLSHESPPAFCKRDMVPISHQRRKSFLFASFNFFNVPSERT
jgi:hypothetical protein